MGNKKHPHPNPKKFGKEGGCKRSTVPPLFVPAFRQETSRARLRTSPGSYAAPRSRAEPVAPLIPRKDVQEHSSRKVFGIATHPAALHRPAVLCTDVPAPTCFRSSLYDMHYSKSFAICQEERGILFMKSEDFMNKIGNSFQFACMTIKKSPRTRDPSPAYGI